ncbi:putative PAS/PAC sensor protein [Thalassoporum mexicanum PCC 7367]|uniref:PAS domain S-box protein n=1 Tax=Thalassoporum mexicanum TaxID=3457544 RepID=UPI00029FE7DD|nr:PAS domain S-box protein [Pseudanabaena sp. PCC 7367]AFY70738.1 putative PAS/PAC sensor protein [Pseudanabaena sp. PCC 7367]
MSENIAPVDRPSSNPIAKVAGRVSIWTLLAVPQILLVTIIVGVVGFLSFRNGQRAVKDVTSQLREEVSSRVAQRLESYLHEPVLAVESSANAAKLDQLPLADLNNENLGYVERFLWQQIRLFDYMYAVYVGNDQGKFVYVKREDNGDLVAKPVETPPQRIAYLLDANGDRTVKIGTDQYNPRLRPWYEQTVALDRINWSDIYTYIGGELGITVAAPLYNRQQQFQGVVGVDYTLDLIGDFLQDLNISTNAQVFIVERSGGLVATSTTEAPFSLGRDTEPQRKLAIESNNDLTKAVANHLQDNYDKLTAFQAPMQLDFQAAGDRQFVQVLPFQDEIGLDWLIVVVVPEQDFMANINANTRITVLLCLAALIVAICIAILTSKWIVNPILNLNHAIKDISKGEWDQRVNLDRNDEVGELANSFNLMSAQLQSSFESLEARNIDLNEAKQELAQANEQMEAVLGAMPGLVAWFNNQGAYLGVNRYICETWQIEAEDLIGQKVGYLSGNVDLAKFIHAFIDSDRIAETKLVEVAINRSLRFYLLEVQKYQQGKAIVMVGIDITERRRAEEALRIAENKYRSIFENALDGIFQATPDGNYLSVNPAMAKIFGYDSPEEMLIRTREASHDVYVDASYRDRFTSLLDHVDEIEGFEYQVYRKDGSQIWIEENVRAVRSDRGKLLFYEGMVQDITRRKQEEAELRRQVQELKIEIDHQKRERDVAQIIQDDYFQELKLEADRMRLDFEDF